MFEKLMENLKKNPPLVHNITNYVTVNDCANIVLAAGGSPLMADDIEEVEDIVSISSALYINVGTLNSRTVDSMVKAGKKANELGLPVVLDPVGMGASRLRNESVNRLIQEVQFSVIKGNMSEIKALNTSCKNSGGVDAQEEDIIVDENIEESVEFAKKVARKFDCVIAATGAIDIVTDGKRVSIIRNGHPMMSRITGTGCMSGSVIGTYCGSNKDNIYEATAMAAAAMGICGEIAYEKVERMSEGTGSFRRYLIDAVSLMDYKTLKEGASIETR
ncbi:hydroxyethylthiazole kinase [Peptoclostridium litorale DSM 5388]|uniref:Hydroxyethylthiazole kinase n=1 Tax=Peptoclostridium litorale DSM 5388 TaxID=1121324 RepID=A0A069RJ01_PEPLI|nr:hydroxyethylthiazole kinase [Peptoclostridium litorale]KDR96783.1 hydroxyethylthiazole kinase ThiM [Peptoclostridium litorale DSM 5388]SIO34426.1 hydroxyethylthiazole kinase [Peptoclostridium litorale DSM 5388]